MLLAKVQMLKNDISHFNAGCKTLFLDFMFWLDSLKVHTLAESATIPQAFYNYNAHLLDLMKEVKRFVCLCQFQGQKVR